MSERVQRIFHENVIEGDAVVLSPSTETTAQPAINQKDRSRGLVWRTFLGWEIFSARNDRIDFTEAGVARVGLMTAGLTYATGALYAAAVQAAMMAAVGRVNTYTVTYSGVTKKITIARTAGAAAFVITWASGPNAARSIGKDAGYIVTANDTGATSYTGDRAAYQSRHWLDIDLGPESCDIEIRLDENDRIDFTEAGVPFVAQVAAGRYTSNTAIGVAIGDAFDEIAGLASVYRSDWGGGGGANRYEIVRFAGGSAFAIQWSSGPNNHRSIGPTLGFAVVDVTGSIAYAAAEDRYGWPLTTMALVSDHNARSQGRISIQEVSGGIPGTLYAIPGDDVLRALFLSAAMPVPIWRVTIEDVQNSDGFFEGRFAMGPYIEPSRSIDVGHEEGPVPMDVVHVADHGAHFSDDLPDPWVLRATTAHLSNDDKDELEEFQRAVGLGRPFWWFHDALNEPRARTYYVVMDSPLRFSHSVGDGNPPDRWIVQWSLREDMP